MLKGRGSAIMVSSTLLMLSLLILHSQVADAETYRVGGNRGWTYYVAGWEFTRRFRAGDVLVFNYNPADHNVVSVNGFGYASCITPRGSTTYTSGSDRITLVRGTNYFLCSFPGHCAEGMRIAVTAT